MLSFCLRNTENFIYWCPISKWAVVTLNRMIGYQQSGSCNHCQGDRHPILFVKYLSSGELLRQTRWMPVLWWMVPRLPGPPFTDIFGLVFKTWWKLQFHLIQIHSTNHYKILHMPRQHSCRGMCKILWWYDAWNGIRTTVILLKNLFAIERSFMK